MKKVIKIILLLLASLLLLSMVFHHVFLIAEENMLKPPGELEEINDYRLHVYAQGNKNNPTLVFMSGSSTVAPVYDFKPLYEKLVDDYRIVVVEKLGYGYSDTASSPRDVDNMLSETRQALNLSGESGPFVLVPHSMSGIEALYWAQQYPDEISAVIGLDMALPSSYDDFDFKSTNRIFALGKAATFLGLHRSFSFLYPRDETTLSEHEINQQKYLIYKNALNEIYLQEGKCIKQSADLLRENEITDTKTLLFVSNGEGLGDEWIPTAESFAEEHNAQIVLLDCTHYVHHFAADEIAEKIAEFLQE